jgi:inorganic triphosphatase YgiF
MASRSPRIAAKRPRKAAPAAPREVELKLRLRPADLPELAARLGAWGAPRVHTIDNVYFDTPDLRLAGARAALRLRCLQQGPRRRWVQTFKTEDSGAALSVRGEWETPAPRGRLDPARLAQAPLAELLRGPDGRLAPLAPVFRTVFERRSWEVALPGVRIEAAIDAGRIEAQGRVESILELELELLEGPPGALFDLALALAGRRQGGRRRAALALLPYGASKAARGVRLARGAAPLEPLAALRRARGTAGRPGASVAQAARDWLGGALETLLVNAAGAAAAADIEFVHQARVALRLMRVGLELLAPGIDLPAPEQRALQRWARVFGAVRDWDVLCGQLLPALLAASDPAGQPRWQRVLEAAQARRARAAARLRRRLDEPAFAEFALRLLRWCATAPRRGGGAIDRYALAALARGRRRLLKALRGYEHATLERQHKIRLQAKNLRYACEVLQGHAPQALDAAQLRALGRFQEVAGSARDLALARATLAPLSRARSLRRQLDEALRRQRRLGEQKARQLAARLKPGN